MRDIERLIAFSHTLQNGSRIDKGLTYMDLFVRSHNRRSSLNILLNSILTDEAFINKHFVARDFGEYIGFHPKVKVKAL